jgi:TnpA family transposase
MCWMACYQQTGLTIEEHYTDTGGASDHVFGLMPFFGYRFAPRLRDIKERRLHLLPGQEAGPLLAGMTGEPIALGHVAAHWDELLRFATSIRTGTGTASAMLRRLSAYPRQNGLPRVARAWPSRTLDLHARLVARHRPAPAHPGGPQ